MPASIRVGLDVRMWHNTGIGRYIRALVRHLPAHDVRLTAFGPPEILHLPELAHVERRVLAAPIHSLAEQLALAGDVPRSGVDLFHAPHLNMPLLGDFQRVVTIHDLIPLHHPDTLSWAGRQYFRAMATFFVPRKANRILTVSEWTRQDLIRRGVPAERIVVAPPGVDESFSVPLGDAVLASHLERLGVRPPFILYAGQWKAYKNLGVLLEAFACLLSRHDGTQPRPSLVLLGRPDSRSDVPDRVRRLGIQDQVKITGYLEDEEAVVALYQAARCFAFPSRHEGFGLPPLEAMAAGTPVVSTRCAALAETVGTDAFLVEPDDVIEWSQALEQAMWNARRRSEIIRAGRERAARYSWQRTAAATLDVYREALVRV